MGALAIAMTVMTELPAMIAAGRDIMALVTQTNAVLKAAQAEGRDPTAAEWDALNAIIKGDVAIIDAAVPLAL